MIDSIPYIILAVIAAAIIAASFRYFGIKAAGLITALSAIVGIYIIGRRDGRADQSQEAVKDAVEIRNKAAQATVESNIRNSDPIELRKSDGFKRD